MRQPLFMPRRFNNAAWFVIRSRSILTFLATVLLVLATGAASLAQVSDVLAEQTAAIDRQERRFEDLARQVENNAENDAKLVEIRLHLEQAARDLLQSAVAFRPRLAEINARLEALGQPPPAEGSAEPETVTAERNRLLAEKAEINAQIGEAESLSIRINGFITEIGNLRRELFANTLTRRYDIGTALSTEVLDEFTNEASVFWRTVSSWIRFATTFKLSSVLAATFFALVAAAVLLIGGRRLFGDLIVANPNKEAPSYLSRLAVAFWSTLLPSAALAVFLALTYFFFDYYGVLRSDIEPMLSALFSVIVTIFFIYRLARAVLSPDLPNWRLLPVGSRSASLLILLTLATAVVTGLDFFLSRVNTVLGAPLSVTIAESLLATVAVGIAVILIALVKPFVDEEGRPQPWPRAMRYLLYLLGGVTVAAALLGYVGLARFMAQQIVVTGAVLATMYIGFLTASAITHEDAFANTALGRRLKERFKLDDATLDQVSLVASIATNVLVIFVGLPLILLQWGFQWGDLTGWAYRFANEIRIGSVSFSLVGILTGLLVFVIGYFVTRWFQGWLDGSVLARGRVDAGVRNSIRTIMGYAGLAIAALIGISAAGIDLSNFALIAGGLSLGIGFGLQNVVSNFVSGLILLAERPFKVGDWIVAGDVSGTVKKISVRATEIETFQRQTVMLPNSTLINAAVGNWTHRNRLGRIEIKVGVAYGSDVRQVHRVLLDIARNHPMVLKNPEPAVLFANISELALEFEIRAFLSDIMNAVTVQNDIRFAIMEAFERERIGIPFQPRAVSLAGEQYPPPPAMPAAPPAPPSEEPAQDEPARKRGRRRRPAPDGDERSEADEPG